MEKIIMKVKKESKIEGGCKPESRVGSRIGFRV
jgi:hypothetical protein